jgi:hypothetical protein
MDRCDLQHSAVNGADEELALPTNRRQQLKLSS